MINIIKEYQKLNPLLLIIIGIILIFLQPKKIGITKNAALNILCVPFNTKKIEIAYKSKYNLIRDNQIVLLMISNGENWHYFAVKSLSRLLRGISSNHNSDYYCLNCFHSYRTENKLNLHNKICENHEYGNIEMPSPNNNIIKYNQGDKSLELPFIIYADLECLLKKIYLL